MLQALLLLTAVTEVFISIFRVECKRLQVTRTMPDENRYFLLQIQWQYILLTASTVVSLSNLCHNLESLSDEIWRKKMDYPHEKDKAASPNGTTQCQTPIIKVNRHGIWIVCSSLRSTSISI